MMFILIFVTIICIYIYIYIYIELFITFNSVLYVKRVYIKYQILECLSKEHGVYINCKYYLYISI